MLKMVDFDKLRVDFFKIEDIYSPKVPPMGRRSECSAVDEQLGSHAEDRGLNSMLT